MASKPRVRVPAGSSFTADTFVNFVANVGLGTRNVSSGGAYAFTPISRNHFQLEMMYRGSWLARQIVDSVAEDMTRAGITIDSDLQPDIIDRVMMKWQELQLWQALQEMAKWGRLYGGAIAVIMIDGQKTDLPLRVESIGRGQFQGLLVLDRWMLTPALEDLVTAMGPDHGKPNYYQLTADSKIMPNTRIHHTRAIRFDGVGLPYWQRMAENGWGLSVLEPMLDRMIAFDSATQGAAQLVYKAHLRTLYVERLRELIAAGGPAYQAFLDQMQMIRAMQTNEGMTLLDSTDRFEALSYAFSGLSEVLTQFGQQLAGAAQIPLVRLFGESPAGMNSTGESDIRNYYDMIRSQQEARFRRPVGTLLELTFRSLFGSDLPEGFGFSFAPLWQLQDKEKSDIANTSTGAILQAMEAGVVGRKTALKELRQQSRITGIWSNITDEDIASAEEEPPDPQQAMAGGMGEQPGAQPPPGGAPGQEAPENAPGLTPPADKPMPANPDRQMPATAARPPRHRGQMIRRLLQVDRRAIIDLHGLQIIVETAKGERRIGDGWSSDNFPADYGYISNTGSAEGGREQMDAFVGPDHSSRHVVIVDQIDPQTQQFDEHKLLFGYANRDDALRDYAASFSDGLGFRRIGGVEEMDVDKLKTWLTSFPYTVNGRTEGDAP